MKGDCYESSFLNAVELRDGKLALERGEKSTLSKDAYDLLGLDQKLIEIVHGWITPDGPQSQKRVHHAWIEIGDAVLETQCGLAQARTKAVYYKWYRVYPNQRYTVDEAHAYVHAKYPPVKDFSAWRGEGEDNPPPASE